MPSLARSGQARGRRRARTRSSIATGAAPRSSPSVLLRGSASATAAGRTQLLGRLADVRRARLRAARVGGAPLRPSVAVSLIIALLGMYWDISLHIDQGRDPGPLANPAHYLILVGLFGVFAAGFLVDVRSRWRSPSPDRDPARRRTGTRRSAAC